MLYVAKQHPPPADTAPPRPAAAGPPAGSTDWRAGLRCLRRCAGQIPTPRTMTGTPARSGEGRREMG